MVKKNVQDFDKNDLKQLLHSCGIRHVSNPSFFVINDLLTKQYEKLGFHILHYMQNEKKTTITGNMMIQALKSFNHTYMDPKHLTKRKGRVRFVQSAEQFNHKIPKHNTENVNIALHIHTFFDAESLRNMLTRGKMWDNDNDQMELRSYDTNEKHKLYKHCCESKDPMHTLAKKAHAHLTDFQICPPEFNLETIFKKAVINKTTWENVVDVLEYPQCPNPKQLSRLVRKLKATKTKQMTSKYETSPDKIKSTLIQIFGNDGTKESTQAIQNLNIGKHCLDVKKLRGTEDSMMTELCSRIIGDLGTGDNEEVKETAESLKTNLLKPKRKKL